jgi:hypothetical protein
VRQPSDVAASRGFINFIQVAQDNIVGALMKILNESTAHQAAVAMDTGNSDTAGAKRNIWGRGGSSG